MPRGARERNRLRSAAQFPLRPPRPSVKSLGFETRVAREKRTTQKDPPPNETKAAPEIAQKLAAKQREISISEFFTKNRHLLGFDSPRRALLTAVKEAVDNALDACEEAEIKPEVAVKIEAVANGAEPPASVFQAERFRVTVEDNGPGIVKEQISKIFAKLLYGSKFHRLRMSRGQQGIGISAAGMYGQLTTGKPTRVISRIGSKKQAHYMEIALDTKKNEPIVGVNRTTDWDRPHGTSVSIEMEGRYAEGRQSIEEYLEQTSIANPHVVLTYVSPKGETKTYPAAVAVLPHAPKEIKPHPHGIELGILLKMLQDTPSRWVSGFLSSDFSRVSPRLAAQICREAGIDPKAKPRRLGGAEAEALYKVIQKTKIMAPPTDCLSPIGEPQILAGLAKQIRADFYTAVTRRPAVYRGNPFVIEAGLAFGSGNFAQKQKEAAEEGPKAEGEDNDKEVEMARLMRFANRVPLLYQQSACAIHKSVIETNWRSYGVGQSRGALPQGPMVIFVHMASVWVPFTSESKEAIASYDEILKEVKLALQEAGRRLGVYVRRRELAQAEFKRRNIFALYIPEVAAATRKLKGKAVDIEALKARLQKMAVKLTGGEKTDALLKKNNPVAQLPSTIVAGEENIKQQAPNDKQTDKRKKRQ